MHTSRQSNRHAKKKAVYQYALDGKLVNIFSSASEGAKSTQTNIGNLCACCRNVVKRANGYFWSYMLIENPAIVQQYLNGDIEFPVIKTRNEKSVIQMDLDNNEIKTFSSIKAASKETGIPAQEISQACHNRNKVTRCFKWKFNTFA